MMSYKKKSIIVRNVKSTDEFIEECREVFSVFDTDGKGNITISKLEQVMRKFGWNPTHAELEVTI